MTYYQALARQIVALKVRHDNLESDFNPEISAEWYEYALSKGMVELLYYKDKLVGFLETIRLNYVPANLDDISMDESGDVALVANVVAGNLRDLLKLKTRAIRNHLDCRIFVWHSKKDNRMIAYRNIRRKHALAQQKG
jgi:hypothetical protein